MNLDWLRIGCEIAVVACGLLAGFFLTFSDLLMKSLAAARPESGIEVMQTINREVYESRIVLLLWGMFAMAPLLIGVACFRATGPALAWIVAAGAIYLAGVYVVTFRYNVPMNKRLEVMDASATRTSTYWASTYLPTWTFWNSIRAAATAASTVCYLMAVGQLAPTG